MHDFRRYTVLVLLLALAVTGLNAWETSQAFGTNFAYYLDEHKGGVPGGGFQAPSYSPKERADSAEWTAGTLSGTLTTDDQTRNLGSGWGAVELEFYYRYRATMPLLVGSGPLTEGNNLRFEVKPVFTPVSLHVETEARFTPIAFLQFHAGVNLGTGWPMSFLGLHGLAMNDTDDISDTDTSGLVTELKMGSTFQFDLAALVPGEFNHVVISVTAKAQYQNYSRADDKEAWYWRADSGQNFNGWKYKGEYALGWQPPWKVNFIGLMAEHNFWLSQSIRDMAPMDAASGENWGSDFHAWRFGPVVNIALKEGHGLTVLLQLQNGLYYTEATSYARYFRRWDYAGSKYVELDRLALAYSWNF